MPSSPFDGGCLAGARRRLINANALPGMGSDPPALLSTVYYFLLGVGLDSLDSDLRCVNITCVVEGGDRCAYSGGASQKAGYPVA